MSSEIDASVRRYTEFFFFLCVFPDSTLRPYVLHMKGETKKTKSFANFITNLLFYVENFRIDRFVA